VSINFHISIKREIYNKVGKHLGTQHLNFDTWQTPTKVTNEIMNSSNPIEKYKEWVMSISEDIEENIYEKDDPFGEREPIGIQIYNPAEEHIAELNEFINDAYREEYEISFYSC